jgi:protein NRD1
MAAPPQNTSDILETLKNMAKQNAANQSAPPTQSSLSNVLGAQSGNPLSTNVVNQGPPGVTPQAVNPLGALFAGMSNGAQVQSPANVPQAQNPLAAFFPQAQNQSAAPPALPQVGAPLGQDAQAQFQILQALAAQGIPPDQWATAIQLLNLQNGQGGLPLPAPANNWGAQNGASSRDRDSTMRSPPDQYRRRSRSPGLDRRRDPSPRRRRDSPVLDQQRDGRRGNDYRQRSPRRRRSTTPPRADLALPPPGPKHIQIDRLLPPGCIRVLSRTLFVGGVTSSEPHLRSLFAKFGIVQTCIVNVDKRHAFVKMLNRKDAERARDGMEDYRDGANQLRVSRSPETPEHTR